MIVRLTGTLVEKNPPQIVVDVQGVGYEIDVPMSTFYNLPATGERLSLHTHMIVREDGHFLYGFTTEDERTAFRQLLKISGVGARIALAVLSGLSVRELAQAVVMQEAGRLVKIPGIGKKTAERLLLELRDRLPKTSASSGTTNTDAIIHSAADDILNALLGLGYSEREALPALKSLPDGVAVPEGIRQALKLLSKA
ncbi:MAG TPA: Holliday junction branch migration protein RuvA [Rhodocyclaceae bacterium]|nr:Holliday junction branch migration protein RuvA [Rhodocyclaceae bacterium]